MNAWMRTLNVNSFYFRYIVQLEIWSLVILPWLYLICFRKHEICICNFFHPSMFSSWKTNARLSFIVNIMTADDLNQCWHFNHWNPRNKLRWNFNQNTTIFIQENTFENVGCETVAILSCPQCFNSSLPSATYIRQWIWSALVQIMACRLFGAKPLSKPMLGYCHLHTKEQTSVKL